MLVAPGSAAGFLPGYSPGAVVLFPMVDGTFVNASYAILVRELTNGTLDPTGESAMSSLSVGFVAVTEANSILYPPFLPTPLLDNPSYTQVFHDGDAYLFERAPG